MTQGKGGARGRPRKNVAMFGLSLVLGGIGVFYSRHYIEEQIAQYRAQLERTEPMVQVVVPKRDMRRGEVVGPGDIGVRSIPEQYFDSNTVTAAGHETALGQRLDFAIDAGSPLLWAHLEGGLTPTFSGKVEQGLRAMTVRVDDINSISGFLQPKDRVDLLMVHGSGDSRTIYPLLEQLDVIATGVQTLPDKSGHASRKFATITVHVTPDQAQRITLAQQVGELTAMLRNPEDEAPLSDAPMTIATLLNLPVPETGPPPPKRRKPAPKPPGIEYIIGGAR